MPRGQAAAKRGAVAIEPGRVPPATAKLVDIADGVKAGDIDTWIAVAVDKTGRVHCHAHLGVHELTGLGVLASYLHRVAAAAGTRLFGPVEVPSPIDRVPRS